MPIFKNIETIEELIMKFPGLLHILRLWFEGYDRCSMQFMGYISRTKAEALIEKAHQQWSAQKYVH